MLNKLVILAMVAFGFSVMAQDESAVQALEGYDPVAYFTKGEAVRGDGFILSKHEGLTYLFSSKENKELFDKNASKYVPQFGGWCAFGASVGKKFHADPNAFVIHNDKLYVNVNADILKKFKEDLDGNIKKALNNWMKIKNKPADSL
ncbi:hypothetical protein K2X33_01510 [bacterium]|nr:hypothetical protein [bacterium]